MSNQSKFLHIEDFCPNYEDKATSFDSLNQFTPASRDTYLDLYLIEIYPFVSHIIGSCIIITIENDQ
jgi:hypothetical protein